MLIRALIVLLIALNLGAAAWWITRPAPPPPTPPAVPQDVARLELLSENATVPAAAAPAPEVATPVATPAEPAVAVAAPLPPQCFSLGPFVDAAAANAAAARLGKQAASTRIREVPGKNASGYNVYLPPTADRDAAQAVAQRIGAAGFDDYLVINSGKLANGIALGRYRNRDGAESRQSALQAAGFPAQVQAIGEEGAAQWWLDLAAAPGATGPQVQVLASAAQSRALDCATLR